MGKYKKLKRCLIDINNQLSEKRMPYETYKSLIIKRDAIKEELKKIPVDGRIVTIGEIDEDDFANMTPIGAFKKAFRLSAQDTFNLETNNPQVLELLEIRCDDLVVFLKLGGDIAEIDIITAYNYLGDLYSTISLIRLIQELDEGKIDFEDIAEYLDEYESKYKEIML